MYEMSQNSLDKDIGSVDVIDINARQDKFGKPARINMMYEDLTEVGKRTFERARTEADRRFKLKGAEMCNRDLIALGCDLRIIARSDISDELREQAR